MLPTINIAGDWIVISKLYSRGRGVGVGDMVSYVRPVDGPGMHVSKRIIGMPGDWVVVDPEKGDEVIKVSVGRVGLDWIGGDGRERPNVCGLHVLGSPGTLLDHGG